MTKEQRDRALWVLVVVGIALRTWQFLGGASLWLDEIAVARNVAERGYTDLLRPLDYGQVAPPGFLFIERFFWSIFHTDWSLRLLPCAGSIASLFLMRALARRVLSEVGAVLATGLFSLAMPQILYAGLVKQYSTDVTGALILTLLAVEVAGAGRESAARYRVAGVAGFLAVWISNTATLVAAGLGAVLALLVLCGVIAERRKVITLVLGPWAVGALAAVIVARHGVSSETMAYMKEFWGGAFAPFPPRSFGDLRWGWRALTGLLGTPWGVSTAVASGYALLAIAGFVVLWRTRRHEMLLLAAPLLVALAASALRQYPLEGRLALFLTPALLIAIAAATAAMTDWLGARNRALGAAVALVVAAPTAVQLARQHPVYRLQETETMFAWLVAHRRPGDAVYVMYRISPNVAWYGPRYGLTPPDVAMGGCWIGEPRRYLAEMDAFRGRPRVWMVIAAPYFAEANLLTRYGNQIGVRTDSLLMPVTVQGYYRPGLWLYDFSDSTRLRSASADQFPLGLKTPLRRDVMSCASGPWAPRERTTGPRVPAPAHSSTMGPTREDHRPLTTRDKKRFFGEFCGDCLFWHSRGGRDRNRLL